MSKISLVIITYNQQLQTEIILESVAHQKDISFDDIEVIVIDDGSNPAFRVLKKYEYTLKVIYGNNGGRAQARNRGIENSNSDFIIFCDGDRVLDDYFIKNYMEHIPKNKLIIGNIREIYIRNKINYDTILKLIDKKRYRVPNYVYKTNVIYDERGKTDSGIPWITTFSGNMGIDKKLIEEIGKFDESFTQWGFEHFELGYRLYINGINFIRCEATNYHIAHVRDIDLLKVNIKDSIVHFFNKHKDSSIFAFQDFLLGNVSLQDIEINKDSKWLKREVQSIYVGVGRKGC